MSITGVYAVALSFSFTVVTPDTVDTASAPAAFGLSPHARDGNLWNRAARYLG